MKLSTLIDALPREAGTVRLLTGADPVIWSLAEDSRRVKQGALFFARAGTRTDGRAYIADALRQGAAAIAAQSETVPSDGGLPDGGLPDGVAWL